MVSIRAIYENGKLHLLDPVELQDGQEVNITIVPKKTLLEQSQKGRKPDLHPGAFQISDDFDEPLSDSFWFGKISYSKHARIEEKINGTKIRFAVHDMTWLKSDEFIQYIRLWEDLHNSYRETTGVDNLTINVVVLSSYLQITGTLSQLMRNPRLVAYHNEVAEALNRIESSMQSIVQIGFAEIYYSLDEQPKK